MTAAPEIEVPAVEREIARDMIRRGLPFVPVVLVVAGLVAGWKGAASAGYAVAIVLVNLLLSAAMLGWGARRGPSTLMAAALGGFLVRMGLVTVAVVVVKDATWVKLVPLAVTVLGTSLASLFWETRYVSASLAFPGLKPTAGKGA
ncbi:MAG: ATP synthase subunit I [Acidobacteria bacterium]|nr:ATP synthase subunit I [Acidobacteriota bacterium]